MPRIRRLELSTEQRAELEQVARRHKLPYMRERARALLKVADGIPAAQVASGQHGVPQHDPDVLYDWLNRYEAGGVAGLRVREGRGRKPGFSLSAAGRCPRS